MQVVYEKNCDSRQTSRFGIDHCWTDVCTVVCHQHCHGQEKVYSTLTSTVSPAIYKCCIVQSRASVNPVYDINQQCYAEDKLSKIYF